MTDLQKEMLRLLEVGQIGLATDIDGTLSPIAATPAAAVVPARCRLALQTLQKSGRFAVIAALSGRAAENARDMVKLPELLYLGNHGMESLLPGETTSRPVEEVVPYQPLISTVLETVRHKLLHSLNTSTGQEAWQQKVLFEDKGVTASIHYRLCPDPVLARETILHYLNESLGNSGLKVSEGRMVIELRPPVEVNKGTALVALAKSYQLKSLVFLGDDLTDVDGFRALHNLQEKVSSNGSAAFRGIAIGVRNPEMATIMAETADFLVEGVAGVGDFLEWLAATVKPAN